MADFTIPADSATILHAKILDDLARTTITDIAALTTPALILLKATIARAICVVRQTYSPHRQRALSVLAGISGMVDLALDPEYMRRQISITRVNR